MNNNPQNDCKPVHIYGDNISTTVSVKPNFLILTDEELKEEEEIGYYKPVTQKFAVFVPEDSSLRETRTTKDGISLVYLFNTDDYKGDLFNGFIWGAFNKGQNELFDYLTYTGKFIQ